MKLPGLTSTMSGNLPVILLGITQLGLFASLLCSLNRSYRPVLLCATKTKAVQFLFKTPAH